MAGSVFALSLGAALFGARSQTDSARAGPRTVWDRVYDESQAVRGYRSFVRSCAKCHALDADGLPRQFTGDPFWASWGEDSLDSLYSFVRNSMPNGSPASLSDATYADIVAFLLQVNGVPPGPEELRADAMGSIRVMKRDSNGRMPDGAFVTVWGCLGQGTDHTWTITRASEPARSRGGDTATEAAQAGAQPLGSATFRLLFILSPLDKIAGHKVLVRGLLVPDPVGALNVTSIQSVATSCTS